MPNLFAKQLMSGLGLPTRILPILRRGGSRVTGFAEFVWNQLDDPDEGKEPTASKIDLDEYYKIARSEIEHEDDLMNHRLTWLVYIETIFFGAFFLLGSSSKAGSYMNEDAIRRARIFVMVAGAVASVLALWGVLLASKAVRILRKRFCGSGQGARCWDPSVSELSRWQTR